MTPPFVPASAEARGIERALLAAMGWAGWLFRAFPVRFCVLARWDDVRDVLEDEAGFATPYAVVESQLVGGHGRFTLGMSGDAHRALRGRLEQALDFARAAPGLAAAARRRVAAGVSDIPDLEPMEFVGISHAATLAALRPWLGLDGQAEPDARLAQWTMDLFHWQFAGIGGNALPEALRTASALQSFVDAHLAAAHAGGGSGLVRTLVDRGVADVEARAWLIGVTVAALPQLPMAAARALNQLLDRPVALVAARAALRRDGEPALWPFVQEALRFDPVAPGLGRVVLAPPAGGRLTTLKPGARVRVLLKTAMRDGRRIARPGCFDPGRGPAAWLGFGAGPHACIAQGLARAMLPAMLAPVLARGLPQRVGRMRAPGLAPTELKLRFGA